MLTNSFKTKFIPANRKLKTVQIIFQIRTYKAASFLNYAKDRVKFSKKLVRQIGLHFISYLPKLINTVLSRTLFVKVKILYQLIESNFRQKSKKFKKFVFSYKNLRKFLNLSDKSVIKEPR